MTKPSLLVPSALMNRLPAVPDAIVSEPCRFTCSTRSTTVATKSPSGPALVASPIVREPVVRRRSTSACERSSDDASSRVWPSSAVLSRISPSVASMLAVSTNSFSSPISVISPPFEETAERLRPPALSAPLLGECVESASRWSVAPAVVSEMVLLLKSISPPACMTNASPAPRLAKFRSALLNTCASMFPVACRMMPFVVSPGVPNCSSVPVERMIRLSTHSAPPTALVAPPMRTVPDVDSWANSEASRSPPDPSETFTPCALLREISPLPASTVPVKVRAGKWPSRTMSPLLELTSPSVNEPVPSAAPVELLLESASRMMLPPEVVKASLASSVKLMLRPACSTRVSPLPMPDASKLSVDAGVGSAMMMS